MISDLDKNFTWFLKITDLLYQVRLPVVFQATTQGIY